jgi:hypothetical protein
MEAFWYVVFKMSDNGIGLTKKRNRQIVKYYNTLQIELAQTEFRLSYLQILSRSSLAALRRELGFGVGLDLDLVLKCPKVSNPECFCRIGGILTSVECPAKVPYNFF